jgi:hypothetical protein
VRYGFGSRSPLQAAASSASAAAARRGVDMGRESARPPDPVSSFPLLR